ncbi:MAG: HDOD domain-containing protein, partial [Planctomycetes bacterium]|nr:HDOD domain-containing protein [Planctomycetota bacterium]
MIEPSKIWSSPQLPTLPTVAIRLIELSKQPDLEIRDVIDLIKPDPAISAKILKTTNSSFFGFTSEVTSIDRAVPLLGTTMVTSLALSFSLTDVAMKSGPLADHYQSYWTQSVIQGIAAEILGKTNENRPDCDYFLSGLLMDLGRLAMLKTISEEYLPVINAASAQQRELHDVETEMLGFDHIEVGIKLMQNWGLPTLLIEGVRYHHTSLEQLAEHVGEARFSLFTTMAAAAAVGDYFCSENKGQALQRLRDLTSEYFSLTESELHNLLKDVQERVRELESVFAVQTEGLGDLSDLMAQANEQLFALAMREHVASTQAMARHEVVQKEKLALKSKQAQLQKQLIFDSLTKTYNRAFFEEELRREISICLRNATPIGLIFCDIDHFKKLNDTCGHQFGDHVLQQVSKSFQKALRGSDVLARFGGEEFIILVSQPTKKGITRVAERIREGVENEEITLSGKRIPVTVSVGAVVAIPERDDQDQDLGDRLIAAADQAMYKAKRKGRNRVEVESLLTDFDRELLWKSTKMRFSRWLVHRDVLDVATVLKVLLQCESPHWKLGELAITHKQLSPEQVSEILLDQKKNGERFGQTAIRLEFLNS